MRILHIVMAAGLGAVACLPAGADASQSVALDRSVPLDRPALAEAQRLFYNARYDAAAAMILAWRSSETEDLAAYEIRTSALLFQLKGVLGDRPNKEETFKQCVPCPDLMAAFLSDTARGQALARARLRTNPEDDAALFFLGKLDLNYVWLQLGTLGRKTGWDHSIGKRESPSTRCSNAIHGMFALASRGPGSITSSTPECREARAGCLAEAARNEP